MPFAKHFGGGVVGGGAEKRGQRFFLSDVRTPTSLTFLDVFFFFQNRPPTTMQLSLRPRLAPAARAPARVARARVVVRAAAPVSVGTTGARGFSLGLGKPETDAVERRAPSLAPHFPVLR